MKNLLLTLFITVFFAGIAVSGEKCDLCGMKVDEAKRQFYVFTSKDGKKQTACNQGCAVMLIEYIKKDIKTMEAVDYISGNLMDAHKAYYVRGSDIKAVMGGQSVIAFSDKKEAEKFQKEHGGDLLAAHELFKTEEHNH